MIRLTGKFLLFLLAPPKEGADAAAAAVLLQRSDRKRGDREMRLPLVDERGGVVAVQQSRLHLAHLIWHGAGASGHSRKKKKVKI